MPATNISEVAGTADGGKVYPEGNPKPESGRGDSYGEVIQRIRDVLELHPEILLCFLFGSAASGRLRADSDVDIAVAATSRLSLDQRLELTAQLSRAVKREVDLVDLGEVTGIVLGQILTKGKRILCRDRSVLYEQMRKLVYWEADMGPLVRRTLEHRVQKFLHE